VTVKELRKALKHWPKDWPVTNGFSEFEEIDEGQDKDGLRTVVLSPEEGK